MAYPFQRQLEGLGLAAGLATAGLSSSAAAQYDAGERTFEPYFAGVTYVTYSFGAEQPLGWGIELRAGAREDLTSLCMVGDEPLFYAGGAARFEWFPSSHMKLLAVAQAGHSFAEVMGAHGELGAGYRFGTDAGFEGLLGAELDAGFVLGGLHFDPMRLEVSPALGVLIPPVAVPLTRSCVIPGRPQRTVDGFAPLPQLASPEGKLGAAPREVARIWGQRAQGEWASLPAFRELAAQLAAAGAPRTLIARCRRAFDDELRHAVLASGHAASFGGGRVELAPSASPARALLRGPAALIRLAVESWLDGCLNEGIAAACAADEARAATHPGVSNTQRAIARDEGQHAELGWDVLSWALDAGGDDVRSALHAVARATPQEPSGAHDGAYPDYGIAPYEQQVELARAHSARALQRLDRVLAG